jgi:hypothetical protein
MIRLDTNIRRLPLILPLNDEPRKLAQWLSPRTERSQGMDSLICSSTRKLSRALDSEHAWKCDFSLRGILGGLAKKGRVAFDIEKIIHDLKSEPDAFAVHAHLLTLCSRGSSDDRACLHTCANERARFHAMNLPKLLRADVLLHPFQIKDLPPYHPGPSRSARNDSGSL